MFASVVHSIKCVNSIPGIVSDNPAVIEAAEDKLCKALNDAAKKPEGPKRKRVSTVKEGQASVRQVAQALGEKPPLTTPQKEEKAKAAALQKRTEANRKTVEAKEDAGILRNVSRKLDFIPSSTVTEDSGVLSDEDIVGDDEGNDMDVEMQDNDEQTLDKLDDDSFNGEDNSFDSPESELLRFSKWHFYLWFNAWPAVY